MIDYYTITKTVVDRLSQRKDLGKIKFGRETELNKDPKNGAWCGVYKNRTTIDPHSISTGSRNKRANGSVKLYLISSSISPDKASINLDKYLKLLLAAMAEEYALDKFNSVFDNWSQYEIDYLFEVEDRQYVQMAVVTLNFEKVII